MRARAGGPLPPPSLSTPAGGQGDIRLPVRRNSNSHGARPVHQIISMMRWIRTSMLSIKNSLSPRFQDEKEEEAEKDDTELADVPKPVRALIIRLIEQKKSDSQIRSHYKVNPHKCFFKIDNLACSKLTKSNFQFFKFAFSKSTIWKRK